MRTYHEVTFALSRAVDSASRFPDEAKRGELFEEIRKFMRAIFKALCVQYNLTCHDFEPPHLWYKAELGEEAEAILLTLEEWVRQKM